MKAARLTLSNRKNNSTTIELLKVLIYSALIWVALGTALAQTPVDTGNGFKPWGSYDGSNLDSVNLENGKVLLHAPIIPTYPQRGSLTPQLILYVGSGGWQKKCLAGNPPTANCYWAYGGTSIDFQYAGTMSVQRSIQISNDPQFGTSYSDAGGYTLTTWDGGSHQLYSVSTGMETMDTTGYRVVLSNPDQNGINQTVTITDRKGRQHVETFGQMRCPKSNVLPVGAGGAHPMMYDTWQISATQCTEHSVEQSQIDANGNQISLAPPVVSSTPPLDTMGRPAWPLQTAVVSDSSNCQLGGLPFKQSFIYSYPTPGGGSGQIKICQATLTPQTNFGVANVTEAQTSGLVPPFLVTTNIMLPDGTQWVFAYDTYGNITSISLPTGGTITYTWETIPGIATLCQVNDPAFSSPAERAVQTRTLNDNNGHSSIWTYHWGAVQSDSSVTNRVTDPLGNDTVHIFHTLPNTQCYGSGYGPGLHETTTQYWQGVQGSGTLLKQVDTSYNRGTLIAGSNGFLFEANMAPTDIQTTVYPSGKVSLVHKDYDSAFGSSGPMFASEVAEKEYDWGQGAPGALLRETDTTYQWQANGSYLTANMADLPASVVVKDGSGCALAETDYAYDESAYLTSYQNTVGALPSGTFVSPPNSVRGNPSTVTKWKAAASSCNPKGGTAIVSHTNWYDTGEVHQQIDALGRATTHSYHPAYAGAYSTQTCAPTTNGGATAHCVSGTYDLLTGLLMSFTNENATQQASGATPGDSAHTTTYIYDFLERMTSATAPPDPNNGNAQAQTLFTYSAPGVLPETVQRQKSVTPGVMDSVTSTYDGLGRVYKTQHPLPNGTAEVDTVYDALGHVASVTNPYFSTSDPTYGVTQTAYDALGRATQVTEQDGSMKAASYSQGGCASGDDSTTTDEAGKSHRTCADGLGRLIEVDEPQSSSVGTSATANVTITGSLNSASSGDAARSGSRLASYIGSNGQMHVDYLDTNNHVIEVSPNSNGIVQSWDLTALANAPTASSSSQLTGWLQSDGAHIVYLNSSGHLQQIWDNSATQDVTVMLGLPAAASGTALTSWTTSDGPFFVYVTNSQHLEQVWFSISAFAWFSKDLTTSSGAAVAASGTALTNWIQSDSSSHVVYVNSSGHLQQIINTTGTQDLTAILGLPAAASGTALTSWVQSDGPHFAYITGSQALQQVWYNVAGNAWGTQDLDGASGGPTPMAGSALATYGNYAVVYQGGNGHIYQDWWSGSAWINNDLTAVVGAGVTAGSDTALASYVDSSGQHSVYLGTNSHLYQLFWNGSLANLDMTASAVIDSGTVTLEVDGFAATACFGPSTNSACSGKPVNNDSAEVAAALAQAVNVAGSPATATANGGTINLVWSTPGPFSPQVAALTTADDQPTVFTVPSFTSAAASFSGGAGPSFTSGYTTLYGYDGLSNLLRVDQKGTAPSDSSQWRTRQFTYDTLGRLLTALNPESGQITYVYDPNSNVTSKTDARGIVVTYGYDELNRVTSKTYSDGTPAVSYGYDAGCCGVNPQNGVGRMTYAFAGNTELVYVYDIMGRVTSQADCPPSGISRGYCYWENAAYDLAGDLTSLGYPDGQTTVTYTPDSAGRMLSAVDNGHGINYATSATYGPDSGLTGFVSGNSGSFAGITNSFSYNKRLQPVNMSASAPSQTVFSIGYDFHFANGNNGNVFAITNYRDNSRNQSFTYDSLNRLTSAQNAGTDCSKKTLNPPQTQYWGNNYSYDAWGNLLTKSVSKCWAENLSVSASGHNQLSGYGYDAAGNMTSDPTDGVTSTYDAESRIITASKNGATSYTYNSLGNRVRKDVSGGPSIEYFYFNGQIVAELNPSTGVFTNYVYFAGDRVARRDGTTGPVSYYFSDHLKTASVVTDATGNIKEDEDYYPWGGELLLVNNDSNHYKFTGKERDAETGLDYFGARYYSNGLGRFITPDWAAKATPVPYAIWDDPQSLNLYGYVRNLPTSKTDLDGHGFWDRLFNRLKEDGCWCEDDELKEHRAALAKERQQEEQRERQALLRRYLILKKAHPNMNPKLSLAIFEMTHQMTLPMAGFSIPEQAIADWLIANGEAETVTALEPTGVGQTADAMLNNATTAEFKTLEEAGTNTLKNAIQNAAKQGEKIVIDARNVPIDKANAASQIARAQNNIGGLEGRVIVITKDGPVKF